MESEFRKVIVDQVEKFNSVRAIERLLSGKFSISDYHDILTTIFYQVAESSSTFALAAANLPFQKYRAKAYLMKHADEEKTHWHWVLNDLTKTGYVGPDPRTIFPKPETAAYIAFNYYTALRTPLGRLGIAAMLESLGATYGKRYAMTMANILGLKEDQMVFYLGHGDTDVGHTQEILDVLESSHLTSDEWEQLTNSAQVAGHLYRKMYDF